MPTIQHLALTGCAAAALASSGWAGDPPSWPRFRGPNGSGVAESAVAPPVHFGPALNLTWKTALPAGVSSPCIWGDAIFLTAGDGGKLETICLDRRSGAIRWRRTAPAPKIEKTHRVSNPANATPAADEKKVVSYFASYGLLCYDHAGGELWRQPFDSGTTQFGSGSSPILVDDLVLLNNDLSRFGALTAFNGSTGKQRWKASNWTAGFGFSTPILCTVAGVKQAVVQHPNRLVGLRIADGRELWSVYFPTSGCTAPTTDGDRLFAAAFNLNTEPGEQVILPAFKELLAKYDEDADKQLSRAEFPRDLYLFRRPGAEGLPNADVPMIWFFDQIDSNRDGKISEGEYALLRTMTGLMPKNQAVLGVRLGGEGDVTKTHLLWKEPRGVPEVPSPLVYQGVLYVVRDGGVVSGLDPQTGKLLFRERSGVGGAYFASPIAGNGRIYLSAYDGRIVVLEAGPKWKALAIDNLGESIIATPALVDGSLYVRTASALWAFHDK